MALAISSFLWTMHLTCLSPGDYWLFHNNKQSSCETCCSGRKNLCPSLNSIYLMLSKQACRLFHLTNFQHCCQQLRRPIQMEHLNTMEQPMVEQAMISLETCLSISYKHVVHFETENIAYTIDFLHFSFLLVSPSSKYLNQNQ